MDTFSFVFSLFGLLMGLALAEAISGFGKALEMLCLYPLFDALGVMSRSWF